MGFRSIGPRINAVKQAWARAQSLRCFVLMLFLLFNIAFPFLFVIHLFATHSGEVRMLRRLALLLFIFAAVVSSIDSAFGQGTDLGTVRGTVTDMGGAVIADATVVITDDL